MVTDTLASGSGTMASSKCSEYLTETSWQKEKVKGSLH